MVDTQQIDIPLDDPLLTGRALLPLRTLFFPLGFPLELATNSTEVLDAARKSWHLFTPQFDVPAIQIELGVENTMNDSMPGPPTFRSRGHLMSIISNAQNFLYCDFSRGFAYGWISKLVASRSDFFRYNFLEATALVLLTQRYLAPVHAALVSRNGRGILLCGDSCAGKSTLAYACARAGWTFITDEAVYLVRNSPTCFGVGNPYTIRFRESAKTLFPELNAWQVTTRPNGKVGFEICTKHLAINTVSGSKVDHVVFVDRHPVGSARLRSFPKADALRWWKQFANYGDDSTRAEEMKSYERLLEAPVWTLRYSSLSSAVLRLNRLADSGS